MTWYKKAQNAEDFEDRNRINENIRILRSLSDKINYASKLVYQTQRGGRDLIADMSQNKTLSSYPGVLEILAEADGIALDSPQRFAETCYEAMDEIERQIVKLEKEKKRKMHKNRNKGL